MLAAVYKKYGSPNVIHLSELPKPVPTADQILVKIHTTTVNRTDTGFRSAEYVISRLFSGIFYPKQPVLGCEFSGVVQAVGINVKKFSVGDEVFGYDDENFGGHAEYKTVDLKSLVAKLPTTISLSQAAALTEGSHYALSNIRAAKVKNKDTVMVYGATGAIGSAAVQLLKHYGAFVVAVAGTNHQETLKKLGADIVIDYQTQDFLQTNYRFDFIFDAVGKISYSKCKPILKNTGIYSSTELGKNAENIYLSIFTSFRKGKKVIFPIPKFEMEDLDLLKQLAEQEKFKPLIDRTFPFKQIRDAHFYVETGQKIGNVLVSVSEG